MAKVDTYSELYPNRFVKSDLLKGQKVTLTIANVELEELVGEKGKEPKAVFSFKEAKRDWVAPKTCGFCIQRMFGKKISDWIGKRVTLYPTTTSFGRETVDCIRVWGSPDLTEDMAISIPQGRKKPLEAVMHKVKPGECGFKGDAAPKASAKPTVNEEAEPVEGEKADFDFNYQPVAE
jgi:hypothetical protein